MGEVSNKEKKALLKLDPVVHSPARLAILKLLQTSGKTNFLYLEKQTGLTRGNLSTHLAKLQGAGYIIIEKTYIGRIPRTRLHLTDNGSSALQAYREEMIRVLGELPDRT